MNKNTISGHLNSAFIASTLIVTTFAVTFAVSVVTSSSANAQTQIDMEIDQVEQKINQVLGNVAQPGTQVQSISDTQFDGIYQVEIGSDVMFVLAQGDQVLLGQLFDSKQNINYSAEARKLRVGKLMSNLDTSEMIVFGPENAERYINVFTDVDCGYCRKLHSEVDAINAAGIQVRYMAFPRSGLGSKTYNTMVSVWCSQDQQSALTEAKQGRYPKTISCANPVSEQYTLGQQVGVAGTPTIVTDTGEMIPGYVPADTLAARMGITQ
ncbi:MAG: DsbC family protein [Proteobacteria bacterium]|jgi:thiol:disulfide interchange protein DsbC|nr:DsbC family protein [Pseudomonadota bacterium]